MKWVFLFLFGIAAATVIIFLVVRNRKDEKQFEEQFNNDYYKTKDEEGDIEIEEQTH